MSIALIVTRGYGNGTLAGDINSVVTRGYDISSLVSSSGAIVSDESTVSGTGSKTVDSTGNILTVGVISGVGSRAASGSGETIADPGVIDGTSIRIPVVTGSIEAGTGDINYAEDTSVPKITLDPINNSYGSVDKLNDNFARIEAALNTQILYRSNPADCRSEMDVVLDMNSNRIYNLPDAVDLQDPVTYSQLKSAISSPVVTTTSETQLGSAVSSFVSTLTNSYVVGNNSLSVYVNGLKKVVGKDYLELTPTTIEWLVLPALTDNIDFYFNGVSF